MKPEVAGLERFGLLVTQLRWRTSLLLGKNAAGAVVSCNAPARAETTVTAGPELGKTGPLKPTLAVIKLIAIVHPRNRPRVLRRRDLEMLGSTRARAPVSMR